MNHQQKIKEVIDELIESVYEDRKFNTPTPNGQPIDYMSNSVTFARQELLNLVVEALMYSDNYQGPPDV